MLQVCKIRPRCFTRASVLAFPDYHKAAISPVTFGLGGKWGITWHRMRAPVFHSAKTPGRLCLKPIHMFSLSRLLGDYEKCLSLEPALILVTHNERTSHWLLDKVRVSRN